MPIKSSAVTIRSRKLMTNPLLKRKQMIIDVIHPGLANISRVDLRTKLAKMYKADPQAVVVFGNKTAFGGGKSTCFALVYDNVDAVKSFEPKFRQARNGLVTIAKQGRKLRKEKKNRSKKIRGSKKHKPQSGKK